MLSSRLICRRLRLALLLAALPCLCNSAYAAREQRFITLAAHRGTNYVVVVSANANPAEAFAAKELAKFLSDAAGADIIVVPDTAKPTAQEIAVGATNRKSLRDVPPELQPASKEGFAVFREGDKVFILGVIPRATLYGVYDFLEQEVGVRFYSPEFTYLPKNDPFQVVVKSRVYDPPLQWRNVSVADPLYALRLRLNTTDKTVPYEELYGGVKWIGPASEYTFDHLVPVRDYFDAHPEYFSYIGGKRVKSLNGHPTQLCLSNPEVLKIAVARVREWVEYAKRNTNPFSSMVVSASPNDSTNFCTCDKCGAINQEEGVAQGGTLIRFVNAMSEMLTLLAPEVTVETTISDGIDVPKVTKPATSVIIRLKTGFDYRFSVENQRVDVNRAWFTKLTDWSKASGRVYVWNTLANLDDYMLTTPNLTLIDSNTLSIVRDGAKGMYAQTQQSGGTDQCDFRNYLLAQCLWRPDSNGKAITKDYINDYHGLAAADIRRFSEYTKDQGIDPAFDSGIANDPAFLAKCDAILGKAEKLAGNEDIQARVIALRLSFWLQMIKRGFAEVGRVAALPNEWYFKADPGNIGIDLGYTKKTSFDDWKTIRIDRSLLKQDIDVQGYSWLAATFDATKSDSTKLALYFGAADGEIEVYLDGKRTGDYKLDYELREGVGFFLPLTGTLSEGKHTVVIQLYNPKSTNGISGPVSVVDLAAPIPDALKKDADRFAATATTAKLTALNDSGVGNPAQLDVFFYPTLKYWLSRGTEVPAIQAVETKAK